MTAFDKAEAERLIALVRQPDLDERGVDRRTVLEVLLMGQLSAATAEIARLTGELDHVAPASERDHLSRASRRMVETVMGDRDALRSKVRDFQRAIDAMTARARIAELDLEAMRPVIAAALKEVDDNGPLRASSRARHQLSVAVDAYRATADTRDAAIAKIAGNAPKT